MRLKFLGTTYTGPAKVFAVYVPILLALAISIWLFIVWIIWLIYHKIASIVESNTEQNWPSFDYGDFCWIAAAVSIVIWIIRSIFKK